MTSRASGSTLVAQATRTPRWAWLALSVLTLATLLTRLVGIGAQLPHVTEADAVIVWQASFLDRPEGEEAQAASFPATFYPLLLAYAVLAAPGRSHIVPATRGDDTADRLAAAGAPYEKARIVVAIVATLIVPVSFLLARRFFTPSWSLLAAALLATSLLDTVYSQQARPHAPAATLNALAMLAILRVLERPGWAASLTAGVCASLAVGALHNGVFVLPPLVLAHLLAPRRHWLRLGTALLVAFASVRLFYPWLFTLGVGANEAGTYIDLGGQELSWSMIDGRGFGEIARAFFGYDPALAILAGIGILIGIVVCLRPSSRPERARLVRCVVLASFPIAFALWWGPMERVEPRFLLAIIVIPALLATYALITLTRGLARRPSARITIAFLALALPTATCLRHVIVASRVDTCTLAARWIETHAVREKERIGIDYLLSLPLAAERAGIAALPEYLRGPWERFQIASADPSRPAWSMHWIFRPGVLRDRRFDVQEATSILNEEHTTLAVVCAVVGTDRKAIETNQGVRAAGGQLVWSVNPWHEGSGPPDPQVDSREWKAFSRTWQVDRRGQPLEIYRIP